MDKKEDATKYDALKLENQLCFPLYACSREIIKQYKPYLDELDLTYTQYIAMMVLWEKKELSVKELGEALWLDSGTLTPLLKKLESKGYVARRRSVDDERILLLSLTDEGRRLRERASHVPARADCCPGLTPEEGDTLYALLYKVLAGLA